MNGLEADLCSTWGIAASQPQVFQPLPCKANSCLYLFTNSCLYLFTLQMHNCRLPANFFVNLSDSKTHQKNETTSSQVSVPLPPVMAYRTKENSLLRCRNSKVTEPELFFLVTQL